LPRHADTRAPERRIARFHGDEMETYVLLGAGLGLGLLIAIWGIWSLR
jgi:hypothetical protein